jgi:hypothetical protein
MFDNMSGWQIFSAFIFVGTNITMMVLKLGGKIALTDARHGVLVVATIIIFVLMLALEEKIKARFRRIFHKA